MNWYLIILAGVLAAGTALYFLQTAHYLLSTRINMSTGVLIGRMLIVGVLTVLAYCLASVGGLFA